MSGYGYDGYTSCSRPYRMSKAQAALPCDFQLQTWCTIPGSAYPWRAVRRFVHENQGLMRRMYGDQRHISVLRAEIESNDVEYLNEWKFQEDVRRRYTTTTPQSTTASAEHITNPYFRPASTTDSTPKLKSTSKSQQIESGYAKNSNPVTTEVDNNNSVANKIYESTSNTATSEAPSSTTVQTTSEQTTVNLSTISNIVASEKTLNTAADITQLHETSTTPCTSTEQTETSTAEPPTATTIEFTSDESTAAITHTEKIFESQLFQDSKEQQTDSSSQSTPTGVVKLRGVNACPVKEEVVAPFWANNTRGEVLALLNLYPFEQYVHWEKCTFEYKQMFCREGCRCEQQYRLHRLLAYDPNNECRGIFSDWFKFPSCCVCRCYDLPVEFQITSRSPRSQPPTWNLYNSVPPDWYRLANTG
ncbi:hypothetical protein B7P43_G01974 [Cryptotermes secundus]|uniref:Spaetzle domain-containing protein n=3 Tax=Cryptotermes secundus TaxID=105785 RepID=A0A2J7Q929_9NEOP|nr:hypothetical protein B7P43_G01974 [Cryptotermes secundus]